MQMHSTNKIMTCESRLSLPAEAAVLGEVRLGAGLHVGVTRCRIGIMQLDALQQRRPKLNIAASTSASTVCKAHCRAQVPQPDARPTYSRGGDA